MEAVYAVQPLAGDGSRPPQADWSALLARWGVPPGTDGAA
jgi:hypothetical protein